MTTFTDTWNATFEAIPPDVGEAISLGPSRIRAHKLAIRERLIVDHSWAGDANDGAHKKLTLIEQSDPSTPAAGQAVLVPGAVDSIASSTGHGGLFYLNEDGFYVPVSEAGGIVTLTDGASTLTKRSGQVYYITPTAARTITLPTTNVGKGWRCEIFNQATGDAVALLVTVAASGGTTVRYIPPGHSAWFRAKQNTPTTPAHWDFESGVIWADEDESTISSNGTFTSFIVPPYTLKAFGNVLRITGRIREITSASLTFYLSLNGVDGPSIASISSNGVFTFDFILLSSTSAICTVLGGALSTISGGSDNISSLDFTGSQTLAFKGTFVGTGEYGIRGLCAQVL